jgi:hypothetical protein
MLHHRRAVRVRAGPWRQVPALLAASSAGQPRPGADELVHKLDCINGWPLSASAVREVHSVLSGAFKQAPA